MPTTIPKMELVTRPRIVNGSDGRTTNQPQSPQRKTEFGGPV